jgi:hypothetical protein
MYICHCLTSLLHSHERFPVDVCRLNRVNLLFQCGNLRGGLLESVLVLLLAAKCGFCGCLIMSAMLLKCLLGTQMSLCGMSFPCDPLGPRIMAHTYRFCSCLRSFSLLHPAHPSDSAGVALSFATSPAGILALG